MGSSPRKAGFTLLEIMVVIAILGMAVGAFALRGGSWLPKTRLKAQVLDLSAALEQIRNHALFTQETLHFTYILDEVGDSLGGYRAFYPYDRGDKGENLGSGETPVLDFAPLSKDTRIREIRIPGSEDRKDGEVIVAVSPLGRVIAHDIVLENPNFPETEVFTIHVNALAIRGRIVQGNRPREIPEDGDFQ